jgi:hypothetical protein
MNKFIPSLQKSLVDNVLSNNLNYTNLSFVDSHRRMPVNWSWFWIYASKLDKPLFMRADLQYIWVRHFGRGKESWQTTSM